MDNKLWMLYHLNFYDRPLTGIGIYGTSYETGEKIYFSLKDEEWDILLINLDNARADFERFQTFTSPDSLKCAVSSLLDLSDNERETYELPQDLSDEYTILCDSDEIVIYKNSKYDIFVLETSIMEKIDARHKLFQTYVGYHTDHDPKVHKAFSSSVDWKKFYDLESVINLDSKKYLTTIPQESIIWYNRP